VKLLQVLTLLHIGLAAVEGALRRRGRGEDVRDRFEAMFIADALVFERDARFAGAVLAST
jgi:hypothetical protein